MATDRAVPVDRARLALAPWEVFFSASRVDLVPRRDWEPSFFDGPVWQSLIEWLDIFC